MRSHDRAYDGQVWLWGSIDGDTVPTIHHSGPLLHFSGTNAHFLGFLGFAKTL